MRTFNPATCRWGRQVKWDSILDWILDSESSVGIVQWQSMILEAIQEERFCSEYPRAQHILGALHNYTRTH